MTHQNQPPIEDRQTAADMTASDSVDTSHPKGMSRAEMYLELQRLRDENARLREEVELWKESARYHDDMSKHWKKEARETLVELQRLRRALEDKP